MGRLKEAYFYELTQGCNDDAGYTPEDYATSQPEWFWALGKAVELVISLNQGKPQKGGNLYGISKWLAVEAIINKREPCEEQAREALGMPPKTIPPEIPF